MCKSTKVTEFFIKGFAEKHAHTHTHAQDKIKKCKKKFPK